MMASTSGLSGVIRWMGPLHCHHAKSMLLPPPPPPLPVKEQTVGDDGVYRIGHHRLLMHGSEGWHAETTDDSLSLKTELTFHFLWTSLVCGE
mmetsp:Transcript_26079/g.35876  ORF Transcript_26079/g.35876 Transcript_26079/m.35876 type:complete len:92 (+) Transcript_26079:1726-2001(+)